MHSNERSSLVLKIPTISWKTDDSHKLNYIVKGSEKEEMELPIFDLKIIANATDNFSEKNKLGEGGFGPVYKVTLYYVNCD